MQVDQIVMTFNRMKRTQVIKDLDVNEYKFFEEQVQKKIDVAQKYHKGR